jgi:hypothetical protein
MSGQETSQLICAHRPRGKTLKGPTHFLLKGIGWLAGRASFFGPLCSMEVDLIRLHRRSVGSWVLLSVVVQSLKILFSWHPVWYFWNLPERSWHSCTNRALMRGRNWRNHQLLLPPPATRLAWWRCRHRAYHYQTSSKHHRGSLWLYLWTNIVSVNFNYHGWYLRALRSGTSDRSITLFGIISLYAMFRSRSRHLREGITCQRRAFLHYQFFA